MRSVKRRLVVQQKRCQNVEAFQIKKQIFHNNKKQHYLFTFQSLKYSFISIIKNIKFRFRCYTTYNFNNKYILNFIFFSNNLPSVNEGCCLTYNESTILKQSNPLYTTKYWG